MFSLTLVNRTMVYLTAVSMSTVHGTDLPNILHHHLYSFSGPSFLYLTENWVGNIYIDKLFSGHIPFSFSGQHPLLGCAVLPLCQHGSIHHWHWLNTFPKLKRDGHHERWCALRGSILKPMDLSDTKSNSDFHCLIIKQLIRTYQRISKCRFILTIQEAFFLVFTQILQKSPKIT